MFIPRCIVRAILVDYAQKLFDNDCITLYVEIPRGGLRKIYNMNNTSIDEGLGGEN